jgi:hypothetical protein
MKKMLLLNVALVAGLAACGDHKPTEHDARALWGTLTTSHVARPFALDELSGSEARVTPRCAAGDAQGELWFTSFAANGQGEASGTALYTLDGCRASQDTLALHGALRRGFKVRRQQQQAPSASAPSWGVSRRDVFYGVLHMQDPDALCPIDVTRTYEGDQYTYTGTLCGHDVRTLGLTER